MNKKLLLPLIGLLFLTQTCKVYGQYNINPVTEIVYSGGIPTTTLYTCMQDSIVYRITESPSTSDTIYIKLPKGISFVSLLADSNVVISHLRSQDSILVFYSSITLGSKFKISILVNTPPCSANNSSSYPITHVWGYQSGDTVKLTTDPISRNGRNPQTGKAIKIAAKKVAKFKAGSELKKTVNK